DVCVTCSDEGRLAEVAVVHEGGSAEVLAAGARETIDVSFVDEVRPGDLVLVHAGVALTVLPEHVA
ncbi:MAG TPA: HypC/HybG/HupF family hydrogenase formation chaperone, partial [Ilumatobacteraceae bacterium]|nr:HypC/HybG/HupF family hydrogenase formation chaperone [Ilumatobacteraceae bacterium]